MKLAVYRFKNGGEICMTQKVDDIPDIETRAKEYNADTKWDKTVEIVEIQENSLEMYLYNSGEFKVKQHEQELEYMSDTLRDLASRIEWLYEQARVPRNRT